MYKTISSPYILGNDKEKVEDPQKQPSNITSKKATLDLEKLRINILKSMKVWKIYLNH